MDENLNLTITITLEGRDEAVLLFGSKDQNLRRIRKACQTWGVELVARGDKIQLDGPEDEVQKAERAIQQLRHMLRKQTSLSSEDIESVLTVVEQGGDVSSPQNISVLEGGRQVRPRTDGQAHYVSVMRQKDLVLCVGPAGSGKTYLAVAIAVNLLRQKIIKRIVLVRPAVEAGERLGFLPGDMVAKINPYLRPLLDALVDVLSPDLVKKYLENDVLEILPLAYMRGRTLNNAMVILDEGQNTTIAQMKMFLTRMGHNSKIIITGDITQIDLPKQTRSGLVDAVKRLRGITGIGIVHLSEKDIVRHPLVQQIVLAYEESEEEKKRGRRRREDES
jgi:phosphate starvation-inducible PhoH-like protein